MPTKRDNDEERDRRVDRLVQERRKADTLSKQAAALKERARRANRQAKAAIADAEEIVRPVRKRRA